MDNGRARGRGRAVPRPVAAQQPTGRGGNQPGPSQRPPQAQPQRPPQAQPQRPPQVQPTSAQPGQSSKAHPADPAGLTGRGGARQRRQVEPTVNTRPAAFIANKQGRDGNPIKVVSNYFKLMTRPKWSLCQYRVDVSPEEDRTHVRRSLLKDHKARIGGYIFDGTVLYTPCKLNPNPMNLCSKRSEDGQIMNITIKLVGDVLPGDYVYLQVFNILMRKCYSSLKLQLLGRDFYDKLGKIDIREHKLQIWPGYKTTIAQHESSILMVAEITHKIIRTDTVLDNIIATQQQHRDSYQSVFNKDIIGQIVLTDYNSKTYRINDVDWKSNPKSTFAMNGENVTYADYYLKKYQLRIRDMSQPLLVSLAKPRDIRRGSSEMVLLIPELCRMTGLTDKMRNDFRLMKAISTYTRVGPETRVQKLLAFNERLQKSAECKAELHEWDMQLDSKLVEINARELPEEKIMQGKNGTTKYPAGDTNDGWTKYLRSNHMLSAAPLREWVVITTERIYDKTKEFVGMVISASRGMSWTVPQPYIHCVANDSIGVYVSGIENVVSQRNPELLFCVVSSSKVDLYNAIKKKCCVDRAIPSQVILAKTLMHRSAMSIATKVAIQMNCKLGGSPWTTVQPVKNLMVIGYDVCHDPRNKNNSYGAMLASIDQHQTRYFNCVTQHTNGEELANEFSLNIKKALQQYNKRNNILPGTIIIYRDGVGEGQITYVHNHEVEVIKRALDEIYGGPTYKLQFVIVSKRLNTRFFNMGRNPKPGTVIDDVVTSPMRYDFFLISQAVRDGTVAPTSYNVIWDNSGLTVDHTQRLAYKFCHMYFNFSGQVRVPAPCQYAHKLAFLSSQNLHHTPNPALNSALFFL